MEFEIIKDTFRPSNIRNGITNSISFLNRIKEQIRLFSSWKKFYFQRQFHNTNVVNYSDIRKYVKNNFTNQGEAAFLPPTKDRWVSVAII